MLYTLGLFLSLLDIASNYRQGSTSWKSSLCIHSIEFILIFKAKDRKEKYEKIKIKKELISIDKLCEGLPKEFAQYLKYCRSLTFEQAPNYFYARSIFHGLYEQTECILDFEFDWIKIMKSKKPSDNEAIKLMIQSQEKDEKSIF